MTQKNDLKINGNNLNIKAIAAFVKESNHKVKIDPATLKQAETSYVFLSNALEKYNHVIYGINTGFGPMASYILAKGQILDLQKNLILSHAAGMGDKIKDEFVLAAMVVRLNTLVKGFSGVSPELLKNLERFINLRIIPVVPENGAVGTSGDLVQLAHIALALLGQGKVTFNNRLQQASAVLKLVGLKPYNLKPKEGLALINGTSLMTGTASLVCAQSRNLLSLSVRNGCLALELVKAYSDSYGSELHKLRPHRGQQVIAQVMRSILSGSKLIRNRDVLNAKVNKGTEVAQLDESIQEVYSMRCVAQILGPVFDTLAKTWATTEIEMNSVTDNPIVDWKNKKFLHGGNFHGEYISVNMDQLKMSLVKLSMLSERRLNFFLNHKINQTFPPFLNLHTPGVTLGLQGLQFVATSTTAMNQTLAYPMNLHSISTNGDNQDVVSMGTGAALLTNKVLENSYIVSTIELLGLCQAVDCVKAQDKLSSGSRELYNFVRENFDKITDDRYISDELTVFMAKVKNWPKMNLFEQF